MPTPMTAAITIPLDRAPTIHAAETPNAPDRTNIPKIPTGNRVDPVALIAPNEIAKSVINARRLRIEN